MASLVLSVSGSDRPGLTKALAGAVLSAGGNWLESHLSLLGGLYVGSVLVEIAEGNIEALRVAVATVDAQGLEVRIAPAFGNAGNAGQASETLEFSLVGQDRPGIVNKITAAVTELGGNIETFETWLSSEAHSGASLFHMAARLRLPEGLTAAEVQTALETISGEIMVDVAVGTAR
jgi:glycine cleavage system regulatory protein